jgi:hypothetical protein
MTPNGREIERRLGEAYAQNLKENPHAAHIHEDCKEVIQASLGILEHYNKVALAMKGVLNPNKPLLAPAPIRN